MIIGINGKIGSGKDTIGEIIQGLCLTNKNQTFEIKKFAGKLKEIASLLTGIPVEKFEDQEFKKALLGEEWGTVRHNPLNNIEPFEKFQFNELMSVREFLQKLGTEAMREGLHTNVWVNALFADYIRNDDKLIRITEENLEEWQEGNYPNWIITDMRFPNEMEAVELREGVTIRVVRPGTFVGTHPSETALDDAKFDYEIINDGTMEDLIKKVREILVKESVI
jgi:hypothetical protein